MASFPQFPESSAATDNDYEECIGSVWYCFVMPGLFLCLCSLMLLSMIICPFCGSCNAKKITEPPTVDQKVKPTLTITEENLRRYMLV